MRTASLKKVRDSIVMRDDAGKVDAEATASVREVFDQICSLQLHTMLMPGGERGDASANDGRGYQRNDSQTLPMFARMLEQVLTEIEREEFAELRMANGELIPIDTSINEGAETYTYYVYSAVGVARFSSAYSSGNLPLVSMQGAKVTGNVEAMENGYAYTTRDIRNAQFAGLPLETDLAIAARRAHDELHHKTGLWGREDLGLPGLLNHPNIIISTPGTSAGAGDDTWPNKTVDEIIADVRSLIDTVDEVTFGIEKVNRVLISRERFNFIKGLRMGTGDGTLTVLKFLEAIYPEVTFEKLNELAGDNSEGNLAAGSHSMFAYTAGNKRKAALMIPMSFRQYPVQQDGLRFVVPCESSTGGVKMPRPLMCNRMDNI